MLKLTKTKLDGVFIIEPEIHGDTRGWFMETYTQNKLGELSKINFVQDNQSYSAQRGIVRGLHCQVNPHSQTKLIRCIRGAIDDVVVDIRKNSPTYKQWLKITLSADNKKQILVPKGFLHGFVTLTEEVEVVYKVDDYYCKECDRSVKYDDPDLGIIWGVANPILSVKDQNAPLLRNSDCDFVYSVNQKGDC